jgi:hypothetical protein
MPKGKKKGQKSDKVEQKKLKKELERIGEEDIETIIASFKKKDAERTAITEEICNAPSFRANASLSPHPSKVLVLSLSRGPIFFFFLVN